MCVDEGNLLERVTRLLAEGGVAYCVIGGQGVNAYAEPLVQERAGHRPKRSRN